MRGLALYLYLPSASVSSVFVVLYTKYAIYLTLFFVTFLKDSFLTLLYLLASRAW